MSAVTTTTAKAAKTFRTGTKQVFLPEAIVTFLRPPQDQAPNFATFQVPLHFNKLDLRDYLLHAYGVRTLGVRSQVRAQKPRMHEVRNVMYRPQSIKTMTAELESPFVWPERPTGAALREWTPPQVANREKAARAQQEFQEKVQRTGFMTARPDMPRQAGRRNLAQEAARLRREGGWSNNQQPDSRFDGVD